MTILSPRALPAGTAAEVELLGAGGKITGRVARSDGRNIVVIFDAGPSNLSSINRALQAMAVSAEAA